LSAARASLAPVALIAALLAGCAAAPVVDRPARPALEAVLPAPGSAQLGQRLFDLAALQLGAPYREGGQGPDAFDCSGLVLFAHARLGISVPRTAAAQRDAAQAVSPEALRAGDLLFFRMRGERVDHVGIYDGAGQFLHAPGRGRGIERARLDAPWYQDRFAGAGRFWFESETPIGAR
jgi:cell wall-associated NlpC family hydrolase